MTVKNIVNKPVELLKSLVEGILSILFPFKELSKYDIYWSGTGANKRFSNEKDF
jgi:hypothetical protein